MWGKMEICKRCGNSFSLDGGIKYVKESTGEYCYECFFITKFGNKLESLLNSKVVAIHENKDKDTFILTFDNGLRLTAEDGEYGDNAFVFLDEGEE